LFAARQDRVEIREKAEQRKEERKGKSRAEEGGEEESKLGIILLLICSYMSSQFSRSHS
jgi:hypothetical protein